MKKDSQKITTMLDIDTSSSEEETSEKNDACMFCNELYLQSTFSDGWIQCCLCREWSHEECSGHEGGLRYVCDFCNK